jgi:hypothetical protein
VLVVSLLLDCTAVGRPQAQTEMEAAPVRYATEIRRPLDRLELVYRRRRPARQW